jgi:hypothetical protein
MDSETKKSYDPSKNDPKKISIENLKDGISERQTKRITYEAMLLRKTPQDLLVIAPFLYQNDITAANTTVKSKDEKPEVKKEEEEYDPSQIDDDDFDVYASIYGRGYGTDGF